MNVAKQFLKNIKHIYGYWNFCKYIYNSRVSRDMFDKAVLIEKEMRLSIPDVSAPGPSGELMLCWDDEVNHLEIEIFPGEPTEYYYCNRVNNCSDAGSYPLHESLLDQMRKVFPR